MQTVLLLRSSDIWPLQLTSSEKIVQALKDQLAPLQRSVSPPHCIYQTSSKGLMVPAAPHLHLLACPTLMVTFWHHYTEKLPQGLDQEGHLGVLCWSYFTTWLLGKFPCSKSLIKPLLRTKRLHFIQATEPPRLCLAHLPVSASQNILQNEDLSSSWFSQGFWEIVRI